MTPAPSASPTSSPAPSRSPSASPTRSAQPTPTREPTREPTQEPTRAPAPQPSATGGSGGAGGAPSSGGSDGGSAAFDVAPGRQEAAVPYAPGTREPQARVEGTGGSSTRPQARGRADEHGGFSPLREHGGEPTLAGVSGWVSYYLDRDDGSARSDRTSGGAPVDSNDNAGVQAVRGESGDAGLSTEAGAGTPDLSALRGPVPIIVFSALALGGIVLVIHRSSRTLGGPRRAGRR
ncbi:hypothetical protein [Rothia kristinae]|uniref:hypothetical protein n=1 Tax=Rothia kristinae TaxID=37923 RepID=UPI0010427F19|nr:hypothetical protein [Rothia kristinae]